MNIFKYVLVILLFTLPLTTSASIITISEFDGEFSEGFEETPSGFVEAYEDLFDGNGSAINPSYEPGSNSLHSTGGWSFSSYLSPHSGERLAGNTGGYWLFEFDGLVSDFGGFFATNTVANTVDASNGVIQFFDIGDNVIGQFEIDLGLGGTWTWNGWASEEHNISKVALYSGYSGGGFLMLDSLQLNFAEVPEPSSLVILILGFFCLRGKLTTLRVN